MDSLNLQLIWQVPLVLMSVVTWFTLLDGFFSPYPAKDKDRRRFLDHLRKRDLEGMDELVAKTGDPLVKLARGFLRLFGETEYAAPDPSGLEAFCEKERENLTDRYEWILGDVRQCSVVVGFLGTLLGSYQVLRNLSSAGNGVGFADLFGGLSGALTSSIYGVLLFLACVVVTKVLERPSRKAWATARTYLDEVESTWRAAA